MIRVPEISSVFARQNRVNLLVCSVIAFTILCVAQANAQTVATYSFEDGTAQGWTSFNGASVPAATNAAAYARVVKLVDDDWGNWPGWSIDQCSAACCRRVPNIRSRDTCG